MVIRSHPLFVPVVFLAAFPFWIGEEDFLCFHRHLLLLRLLVPLQSLVRRREQRLSLPVFFVVSFLVAVHASIALEPLARDPFVLEPKKN